MADTGKKIEGPTHKFKGKPSNQSVDEGENCGFDNTSVLLSFYGVDGGGIRLTTWQVLRIKMQIKQ